MSLQPILTLVAAFLMFLLHRPWVFFDYDNTLALTELGAFIACTKAVNAVLASHGVNYQFTSKELMTRFIGCNAREIIATLAEEFNFQMSEEDRQAFVKAEKEAVIAQLASALEPTAGANKMLSRLRWRFQIAIVTSSAQDRVNVCLQTTGQQQYFLASRLLSAATRGLKSKPNSEPYDVAVKMFSRGRAVVAVEDSINGTKSAVAANIPVIGIVAAYDCEEQIAQAEALLNAGARVVIFAWSEFDLALEKLGF